MTKFPFPGLPWIPQELIIRQMKPGDVISFGQTSTRIKRMVQGCHLRIRESVWTFTKKFIAIDLFFPRENPNPFTIKLQNCTEPEWKDMVLEHLRNMEPIGWQAAMILDNLQVPVHNHRMIIYQCHGITYISRQTDDRWDFYIRDLELQVGGFGLVSQSLWDLFRVEKVSVTSMGSERWLYTRNLLQSVTYFEKFHFVVDTVERQLTNTEIQFLLSNVNAEKFEMNCRFDTKFSYSEPLHQRNFVVDYGHWLQLHNFLEMSCQHFSCEEHNFSSKELNELLIEWVSSNSLGSLETFHIRKSWVINRDQLFDGIEVTSWNQDLRPRFYKDIDCSTGEDIRSIDGRLATVKIETKSFFFVAWNPEPYSPE